MCLRARVNIIQVARDRARAQDPWPKLSVTNPRDAPQGPLLKSAAPRGTLDEQPRGNPSAVSERTGFVPGRRVLICGWQRQRGHVAGPASNCARGVASPDFGVVTAV